jgi:uncharacterized membrane protein YdbT with pleckstrin-like domain
MGTYAESLLTPDEKVLRRERQHPIALLLDSWLAIILWGAVVVLLLVRLILPADVFGTNLFGDGTWFSDLGSALTLILLLAGVVVVAVRWWWWRTQEFLVTNRRLVLAWGVLNKTSSDSSLEKINDAQLEVTVLGRMLDYGTLKVMTAAPMAGSDYLDRLNHAKDFKKTLMTAKHDLQSGGDGEDYLRRTTPAAPATDTAAAAAADDISRADTPEEITAVLTQLSLLHDAGSLSDAEYEAKKQELLGRL